MNFSGLMLRKTSSTSPPSVKSSLLGERVGEKDRKRGRQAGGKREIRLHGSSVDPALQSKMLPCKGLEVCEALGLDLRALEPGCNLSPFQVCACGSKDSLSIKPSLLQLTILNLGALDQPLQCTRMGLRRGVESLVFP